MKHLKLTFLLTVLMSMVGATALAHDIEVKNADGVTIYYNWNSDTELAVTCRGSIDSDYDNEYRGNVVIPESVTYNGKEYSVTSIGNGSFARCTLTSITIPNSVTSIGEAAFRFCTHLTSITIPNSVTTIGSSAFYGCSGLTSVTIGNSVTSIGGMAFYSCIRLTSVTIGNSVTSIGFMAFDDTPWLNKQPDGLVYAGKVAYKYKGTMPANTSITLKEGTLGIASSAFYKCSGLTSVTIPNSVTNIGGSAFYQCSSLTSITIPNSVTSIGGNAFYGCTGLTAITIPESVTSIGEFAFKGCTGLTSVTIPSGVTSIGIYAFEDCSGLTSVTIGNSVTSIEYGAFQYCSGLTAVAIPNSVESIGGNAFADCIRLTSVTVMNPTPVSVGTYTFSNRANATLYVPAGSKAAYEAADYWKEFKEIVEIAPRTEQMVLTNNADNSAAISNAAESGKLYDVTLDNRTFRKNGTWHTLCLPFNMTEEQIAANTDFAGATLMMLDVMQKNGFDPTDGTLYLRFKPSTEIEAGVPYLVKWEKAADYDANPSAYDIVNPVFEGVTISNAEAQTIEGDTDGSLEKVQMVGLYSPFGITANDKSILYMGGANKLYYSTVDQQIGSCRAFFSVPYIKGNVGARVSAITLLFDDDVATGITSLTPAPSSKGDGNGCWYTIEGRKLSGKPTQRGLYIKNGRKLVMK